MVEPRAAIDSREPAAAGAPDASGAPVPQRRRLVWEDWVAIAALALLAAITFANVLVRYFTSQSFAWTEEISVSLMVVLAMAAGSAALVRDRHIRIEILFGPGSGRHGLAMFSDAASALAFAVLTVLAIRLAYDDLRYEVTSPGIGVPQWWYTVWLPVFAATITARALQRLVRRWRKP